MKEQLILFETAKLAKEKGFKEWTFDYYDHEGLLRDANIYINCDDLEEDHGKIIYRANTQSLLQKWLRDKHNIHIDVNPSLNTWSVCIYQIIAENLLRSVDRGRIITGFNSYEPALEEGIFEALKLIKP